MQGQQLLKSRLLLRPPAHDSNLHRNMTQNLALARQASTKVKANAVLEDFGHEHMAALDRDKEQIKLRCALPIHVYATASCQELSCPSLM